MDVERPVQVLTASGCRFVVVEIETMSADEFEAGWLHSIDNRLHRD